MFTFSGKGTAVHAGNTIRCQAGDILIVPPHATLLFQTAPAGNWEKISCRFDAKLSWTVWLQYSVHSSSPIRIATENSIIREEVRAAFSRIVKYDRIPRLPVRHELIMNALEEILLLTLNVKVNQPLMDTRIQEILAYLAQHYADKCHIADLGRRVCLSPSRLSHLFKEQTGESIMTCLTRFRLEQAEKLLRYTTRPIHEIAMNVGFNSPDYFARKFKERYSLSPKLYRKKYIQPT